MSGDRRAKLKGIADATLDAIDQGFYTLDETTYDLRVATGQSKRQTTYYAPDSLLSTWASATPSTPVLQTKISLLEVSTLEGARYLHDTLDSKNSDASQSDSPPRPKVGVLNFASAKKPGGGFKSGAQAQEESIARSSTLYPTLMTRVAQAFYTLHNRDPKAGYYTHAMIYSPGVTVFRADNGDFVEPYPIDVLTSPAVNAGVARQTLFGRVAGTGVEGKIEQAMRERMARILHLFEQQGVKHLVLGSFGTGVFKNKVDTVASIWVDLLVGDNARFAQSFEHVVFAVLGRDTYDKFRDVFDARDVNAT
ncbi:hypothetical protein L226DRAFT_162149 [Lentinus tigrinus ALCF2SS1-7]|uniref:Microbial-type PARG catalytic domain-containing protein n=1 Tax=Lentinus tigrinus ALCF2SS1-6 TaxID=1328759 RepID=A0A5C2S1Y8_9APHY|nr:hypothetical protein L227DRAFT_578031 [Lentinus tigrinus ALCF2SS1-6]RPD72100.1 hypothetical protein L226DRAFT_162149 [Lentinus tigrinus ALCF2SS1-7]